MKKTELKCNKCGAIPKRSPKRHTIEAENPEGATTVLGRKMDYAMLIEWWECLKCHYRQCSGISLPLDPDALLIREVFNFNDEVSLEDIVAWLKENNITAADLDELDGLKRAEAHPDQILEWWTKRGLAPVVIVPKGQNQPDDPWLAKLRAQGISVEEDTGNNPDEG